MSGVVGGGDVSGAKVIGSERLGGGFLPIAMFCIELTAIVALAMATGIGLDRTVHGSGLAGSRVIELGLMAALLYTAPLLLTRHYAIQSYREGRRAPERRILAWHCAIIALGVVSTALEPRGATAGAWLLAFYVSGLGLVLGLDSLLAGLLARSGTTRARARASVAPAPAHSLAKRGIDVVLGGVGLVLLSPLLGLIALLVKLDSEGPVFFRQRRRGYGGKEFLIWKFRTMSTMDDGDVVKQAERGDARVTRVGRVLRRLNLDELPQLINVLAGEMSLVGPRPHALAHDRYYETRIADYTRRLDVRPGLTGWAQVNGHRGATETLEKMELRVRHDLAYIDNWSIGLDLRILLLTVTSPTAFRNAY